MEPVSVIALKEEKKIFAPPNIDSLPPSASRLVLLILLTDGCLLVVGLALGPINTFKY